MVMDDIKIENWNRKRTINRKRGTSVSNIHAAHVQKSSTLNRRHVKMPAAYAIGCQTPEGSRRREATCRREEVFTPIGRKPAPQKIAINRPVETPVTRRAQQRPLALILIK